MFYSHQMQEILDEATGKKHTRKLKIDYFPMH